MKRKRCQELCELFGLVETFNVQELGTSYRRRSLNVHPDRPGGNGALFMELHERYYELIKIRDDVYHSFYKCEIGLYVGYQKVQMMT